MLLRNMLTFKNTREESDSRILYLVIAFMFQRKWRGFWLGSKFSILHSKCTMIYRNKNVTQNAVYM